jgi:hypothetical protein
MLYLSILSQLALESILSYLPYTTQQYQDLKKWYITLKITGFLELLRCLVFQSFRNSIYFVLRRKVWEAPTSRFIVNP